MKPEIWVSIYAAIVGTSAFLLNLKAWFDSGVKLSLAHIPDGVVTGGDPRFDDKNIVIVSVTNRGTAPTMITTLVLFEFPSWWRWMRGRPSKSFVVPWPELKGYPPSTPFELSPSKSWTGRIRRDQKHIANLDNGTFYVAVYASHREKPYLKAIPKAKAKLPPDTKKLE